jgi:hypothetical protein
MADAPDPSFADLHPNLDRPSMDALLLVTALCSIEALAAAMAAMPAAKKAAMLERMRANCAALTARTIALAPPQFMAVAKAQDDMARKLLEIVFELAGKIT